ncbi:hypothetical protein F4801DRAFT_583161 [Xylaria longipes]|nr:hypothetical protein F4801DRAFT_583161 [Xylaria longipes]
MELSTRWMSLVPWHEENELSTADINPANITPSFFACQTSVIGDEGDAEQLAQSSTVYSKHSEDEDNEFHGKDDLHRVGGAFPLQYPNQNSLDDNQAEFGSELLAEQGLERCLRSAMVNSIGCDSEQKLFVPVDDLDSIINTRTVLLELERLRIVPDKDLRSRTRQICGIHNGKSPQDGKITITTR